MKPDIKQIKGIENYKKYKLKSDFTTNGTKFLFKKDSIVYAKPSYNKDFLDVVNAKENLILIPVNILEIVPNETKITDLSYQLGIPTSATIRTMPTAPTPISKTPLETENKNSTGTKYKILKTNKFSEPPFKVGDIVEGTLDSNGFLVVKRDFEGNKNVQFQFAKDEFEQVGSTTTSGSASGEKVTKSDKSDFWSLKNPFHYTVIAGAIIGFFYAKNKAKNILASTLIGAGIGGGLGIVANKFMGKKTTTSTKSSGDKAGSGSSDKVTDDKLIDAMINSMRQMVVSLAVTFGQDKAKAEADFNRDFEKQKPQVIAKGKEVLATMNDNEKQAVYEMILFETDLYSKAKTQEDAEKIESQLNSKIQELSTKYSVDLKSAIDKLKGQKF